LSLDRRFGLANTAAPAVRGGSMGSRKPSGAVEQRKEAKGKAAKAEKQSKDEQRRRATNSGPGS